MSKIVFDMDNTLSDEFGKAIRPNIIELLEKLTTENHQLFLWTNSRKDRAIEIINRLNLRKYFKQMLFREDYDPDNKGNRKDIRKLGGDILIDDDPKEIAFTDSIGLKGIYISPYRAGGKSSAEEIGKIYQEINKLSNGLGRFLKFLK